MLFAESYGSKCLDYWRYLVGRKIDPAAWFTCCLEKWGLVRTITLEFGSTALRLILTSLALSLASLASALASFFSFPKVLICRTTVLALLILANDSYAEGKWTATLATHSA